MLDWYSPGIVLSNCKGSMYNTNNIRHILGVNGLLHMDLIRAIGFDFENG